MDPERENYAEAGVDQPPLASARATLILLAIFAAIAAVWFYFAVLLPARAC